MKRAFCVIWRMLTALSILLLHACVVGTGLSDVRGVALDVKRMLTYPTRVRAIYGAFQNQNSIWVQLWKTTLVENVYTLEWQHLVTPMYGNGSIEVINLTSVEEFDTNIYLKLAVINDVRPGPLDGIEMFGGGVVLSPSDVTSANLSPANHSSVTFDDLVLPYHIPIYLCNTTGCPYELNTPVIRPTEDGVPPDPSNGESRAGSLFLTDEMIVGLIVWNILLTVLLFIVFLVLACLCGDSERRRRGDQSLSDRGVYENEVNWKNALTMADGKMTISSKLFRGFSEGQRTPSAISTFPRSFGKQLENAYDNITQLAPRSSLDLACDEIIKYCRVNDDTRTKKPKVEVTTTKSSTSTRSSVSSSSDQ